MPLHRQGRRSWEVAEPLLLLRYRGVNDPDVIAELVRPGVQSYEPVVDARNLVAYAFREYELAGGAK